MKTRQITVTFEKRLSDGNYGSELASSQLVGELEPDEDADEAAIELMAQARQYVEAQLGQSRHAGIRVAMGLNPPQRQAALSPPIVLLEDHPLSATVVETAPDQFELEELPF